MRRPHQQMRKLTQNIGWGLASVLVVYLLAIAMLGMLTGS